MTRTLFHTRLDELLDQIVDLGRRIENALDGVTTASTTADHALAQQVLATYRGIGRASGLIRDASLELLATQQPLASDLRLIFASMGIATDLERMGSHTRSIARLTLQQNGATLVAVPAELTEMAACARLLLHEVIDAFRIADATAAQGILHAEDAIDRGYQASAQVLLHTMTTHPDTLAEGMRLLKVAHKLERIGDHISNIAERTIFLSTGTFPGRASTQE